jgi:hypothetical protein
MLMSAINGEQPLKIKQILHLAKIKYHFFRNTSQVQAHFTRAKSELTYLILMSAIHGKPPVNVKPVLHLCQTNTSLSLKSFQVSHWNKYSRPHICHGSFKLFNNTHAKIRMHIWTVQKVRQKMKSVKHDTIMIISK